jgi:ParB family chromosome partitioning protein
MEDKNHISCVKKIADLLPYVNNSRTHSDDQINQVAASIKEFGFTNPVLINSDCGIIAGHGRVMAAKKLGISELPCIELVGLTAAQKKAYVIADNQLALNAGWNLDTLKIELESLDELDFNLDLLGFDDDFLSLLLGSADEADFPELADGEKEPFQQKTFTLHDEQVNIIDEAILKAKTYPAYDEGLNENSNGNALSFICAAFIK